MEDLSFGELVNSAGVNRSVADSDFVRHFCAKQALHISQDDRQRFEHLLSWDRINEILSLNLLDRQRLRVTRDGRDIPPALYRNDGTRDYVSASKFTDLIRQNASVVMNRVQDLSPAVRRLSLQMERALNQKINVNGYMTFGSGGAFAVHYDPHDVFVTQVYGTKHWFLYDEPEPSPTLEEKRKATKPAPRNVVFDVVLQPGDILYVPRGVYHRAAVTDTDSVHLTFGIHTAKGVDFIEKIRESFASEELFRRDILTLSGPEAVAEQEKALKARLCEIINAASMADFLDEFEKSRKPLDQFRLGPKLPFDNDTLLAPMLRYSRAWADGVAKKGGESSPAAERVIEVLMARQRATVGEIEIAIDGAFDRDTLHSTLVELIEGCWIEIVR